MRSCDRKKMVIPILVFCLVITLAGCESLGRKFVRKPKGEDKKTEDVVFAPEEYKAEGVSREDLYRQYFLFWKTWQDELIDALEPDGSRKKQFDSLDEAVKNLENLKVLLKPEAALKLEGRISEMGSLRGEMAKDIYLTNALSNRRRAEKIKRDIFRDFAFARIKDSIL